MDTNKAIATRITYAYHLRSFLEFLVNFTPEFAEKEIKDFDYSDLKNITPEQIEKYLTVKAGQAKETPDEKYRKTNHLRKTVLSSFYNYLIRKDRLDSNPCDKVEPVKVHKKETIIYLTDNEKEKFLNNVYNGNALSGKAKEYHDRYQLRDVTLIELILNTGLRVSEVNRLDMGDISLEDCSITLIRKGGKTSEVWFSDDVRSLLIDYMEHRKATDFTANDKTAPLFVTNQNKRLSVRAIQQLVKKYSESALDGKGKLISPHKLRSTMAMNYLHKTNEIQTLQLALGHEDITTTTVYARALKEDVKKNRNWNLK